MKALSFCIVGMEGNKEPFVEVDPEDISQCTGQVTGQRSHPGGGETLRIFLN